MPHRTSAARRHPRVSSRPFRWPGGGSLTVTVVGQAHLVEEGFLAAARGDGGQAGVRGAHGQPQQGGLVVPVDGAALVRAKQLYWK